MNIDGKDYTSIWREPSHPNAVVVIDQRKLPFVFEKRVLSNSHMVFQSIQEMWVRGAPLIGVTGAYGIYFGCLEMMHEHKGQEYLVSVSNKLLSARPTAVNLKYGIEKVIEAVNKFGIRKGVTEAALNAADRLREKEINRSSRIADHGVSLLRQIYQKTGKPVNVLTHCNAGWLACIDYGTALAPVYKAHEQGIPVHVYVDETRPRNQGARLTAWELATYGIPYTIIADNTGGFLMIKKMVDIVIVGSDVMSINGDIVNKIGTYLKALAAKDNDVPFYAALPLSTIKRDMNDVFNEVEIEERSSNEIRYIEGWNGHNIESLRITPKTSNVLNYGFDITPSRLITGIITDAGILDAKKDAILKILNQSY
ncbi:MAG: S-methyl-5-thioribose-1-phosphate isomerase [Bacteroidales bacterium]|nr:S-methyl-5-thioribose-1-phosphate isomerase [Bacteroidales bacterium]